jgi:aminopeptidase
VRLKFAGGQVVEHSATKGEDFLTGMLDSDAGARRLGEFAIGNNWGIPRFTKNMLFDEKLGGTIHCALGHGFPETGSQNESALHWDMLCDMRDGGVITVDGVKFYEEGKFLV